jgi:RNA polymerase sigma-70 factor (ECF subfamily)
MPRTTQSTVRYGDPAQSPVLDFGQVVSTCRGPLLGRALWLTKNDSDARDLCQETIARALRRVPPPMDSRRLLRWLFTIMLNAFLDDRRARAVRRLVPDGAHFINLIPQEEPTETPLWRMVDDALVHQCIDQLPTRMREPLRLFAAGTPYVEIAARLRIRPGTVGTRIFRARRRLRALLIRAALVA